MQCVEAVANGLKWLFSLCVLVVLVACGGGATTPDELPDTSVDSVAPVISLVGDSSMTLSVGDTYLEPGASANDDVDGSVPVTISGVVDTATVGRYTLTYAASDAANNTSSKTRIVDVVQSIDTTPPAISLNGPDSLTIALGGVYEEQGAEAFDDRDGEVAVDISGVVDTSVVDVYTVTYRAMDLAGNTAEVTRTVHVVSSASTDVFSLSGTFWRSTCNLVEAGHPDTEEDTYQRSEQRYDEGATNVDIDVYIYEPSNSSCTGGASYLFSATYSVVFGAQVVTDSGLNAHQIDMELVWESIEDSWEPVLRSIIYRDGSFLYGGIETENPQTRPSELEFDEYFTLVEE
nr:DUF5011 domain-containing protein [Simiduia aestuariiviva]